MQPEAVALQDPESDSPGSTVSGSNAIEANGGLSQTNGKVVTKQHGAATANFPPPKTDKPRPHTCNTCGRSFARLEHLKRHERSHTKEKPFECPECNRCFARRDLLLRHQQKLHLTNATTRPRNGRRESVVSVASNGRVRKNSIANMSGVGMPGQRPRANTISHIDAGPLAMFNGANPGMDRMNALGLGMGPHMGVPHPGPMGFDHRGLPTGVGFHGNMHGLPKIDTHFNNADPNNSLRTAPPYANFGGFDVDQLFTPNTTVNPAALHFGEASPMPQNLPFGFEHPTIPEDDYAWVRNWNMQTSQGQETGEQVLEESSPSRVSSGDSPVDYSESMNNSHAGLPPQNNFQWQQHPDGHQQQPMQNGPFPLEALGSGLQNLDVASHTLSPATLHSPVPGGEGYFHPGMMQQNGNQQHMNVRQDAMHNPAMGGFGDPLSHFPSNASSGHPSLVKQNSATSVTADSITDNTRRAIEQTLSPSASQMNRKYSQANVNSPLSSGGNRTTPSQNPNLPATEDLVKYVEAFIQFALPHLPVVHMPTLTFDSVALDFNGGSPSPATGPDLNGVPAGAQCLLLIMAAIGALYEYDHPASKKLFDSAKKMISMYLEERRKIEVSAAQHGGDNTSETPMWLVEAMLLTVIYGHHCGDKLAADIANNHIAALVSLARAAKLSQPPAPKKPSAKRAKTGDVEMGEGNMDSAARQQSNDLHSQWIAWKEQEERKRIFFAIFILSSLLTTAYSLTPAIMNSEIHLTLPCDEGLWTAETAQEWQSRGGAAAAESESMLFSTALSNLLTANQRQGGQFNHGSPYSSNPLSAMQANNNVESDLKPSTFGCYVLINALHNYIWETRSRHQGREWTLQESESMVDHIEPALTAWHAAWKANDNHRLERPNPFGLGPLSADSRPLLDLAFLRLYVNFSRTLECFWQRDFDTMAEQLRHEGHPPGANDGRPVGLGLRTSESRSPPNMLQRTTSQSSQADPPNSRRERYLRRAAIYAADSLAIACRLNLTYADAPAHELPIQSAICFADSSRVLAEWVTTVQERVGRYIGVIGRDPIDFTVVPAVVLLATEDMELLSKIEEICNLLESKRQQQENLMAMDLENFKPTPVVDSMGNVIDLSRLCLGSRTLRAVATMLEKAVIWPVTQIMARALETTATHIERRAEESLVQM